MQDGQVRESERARPIGIRGVVEGTRRAWSAPPHYVSARRDMRGGVPGREAMAMAVCGNLVTTRPRRGAARIMLASRWRDHRRFLPPAGEVKDNVSALELTGILHANPKPQELRAFFAKIAIEK